MAAAFPVAIDAVLNPHGQDAVARCLQVCGCSAALRASVIGEGVTDMDTLRRLNNSAIDNMAKRVTSLPANRGGARFGEIYLTRVKALCLWAKERHLMNQAIDGNLFTNDILNDYLDKLELERDIKAAGDTVKPDAPEKFKPIYWVSWKRAFWNWLSSMKSANTVPLTYVIRKTGIDMATYNFADDEERRLYTVGLTGPKYMADRTRVYQLMNGLFVDTEGWSWVSRWDRVQDGRSAYNDACSHYDGPGETQKRIVQARANITDLFYKSEASFTFERFATKLREAYAIMDDNDEPVLPQTQVRDMCDRITCEHTAVITAVTNVRTGRDDNGDRYRDSFASAVNHISEVISQAFPRVQARGFNKRSRVASMGGRGPPGRGGRGRGRSSGRFGRGGRWSRGGGRNGGRFNSSRGVSSNRGGKIVNGVDVSDLTRWYTEEELSKLPYDVKQDIWKAKHDRIDNKRGVSAIQQSESGETPAETTSQKRPETGGQNGRQFGAGAYSSGSTVASRNTTGKRPA